MDKNSTHFARPFYRRDLSKGIPSKKKNTIMIPEPPVNAACVRGVTYLCHGAAG